MVEAGFEARYVRSFAGETVPSALNSAAGLVVMGGPMGVYDRDQFPFLRQELSLIEKALAEDLPILGVCLGSQLLATALGAPVRKGPVKEIGWHRITLEPAAEDDPLFSGAPLDFDAFHWHGDVFGVPAGAVKLARSHLTECQAFRYGQGAYGILFHLEVTSGIVACMLDAFADELREEGIAPAELASKTTASLAGLEAIGKGVFGAWSRLLSPTGHYAEG